MKKRAPVCVCVCVCVCVYLFIYHSLIHSFILVNIYHTKLVVHWMKEFSVIRLFYLSSNLTQWIHLTPFTSEETEAQ